MAHDDYADYWDKAFIAGVKRERLAQGMSQSDLAEKMSELGYKFHQTTVNKIENGERKVTASEAYGIAEVFDVAIEYLFDWEAAHSTPEARLKLIATQADSMLQSLLKLDEEARRLRIIHAAFVETLEYARDGGIRYPKNAIHREADLAEHYWPLISLSIQDEVLWRLREEVWQGEFAEIAGQVSGVAGLGDVDWRTPSARDADVQATLVRMREIVEELESEDAKTDG